MSILLIIKRFDHYRRATLFTLPVALGFLLYLIAIGGGGLFFPDWFLDILFIPVLVNNLIAGATYLGRTGDAFAHPNHQSEPPRRILTKQEKLGLLCGVLIGLIFGIASSVLGAPVPFLSVGVAASIAFSLNQVANFGGLFQRITSCSDSDARLFNERVSIGLAALLSIAAGIALFATCSAGLVSVVGVTTFFSGGAALPIWMSGMLFVSSFASSFTSFGDYASKGFNFLKVIFGTSHQQTNERVKSRLYEYGGACGGVSVGALIGITIVVGIALAQPYLFAGVLGIMAAIFIVTTAASVMGGLFSRAGHLFDGFAYQRRGAGTVRSARVAPEPMVRPRMPFLAFKPTSGVELSRATQVESPTTVTVQRRLSESISSTSISSASAVSGEASLTVTAGPDRSVTPLPNVPDEPTVTPPLNCATEARLSDHGLMSHAPTLNVSSPSTVLSPASTFVLAS